MLRVEGLSAGYGGNPVLREVALEVPAGTIVALIGANGAGKSTLARVISGLMAPQAGRVWLDGANVTALSPPERLARGLAHVPEGRQVFAGLTVGENLRLGAYGQRRRLGASGMTRRISEVCDRFLILAERFDTLAGNLSGGQQQLLAIGRALMAGPRVLVLDEPSLGLAPLMVAEIFQLIRGLRDAGLAILLAEQNARQSLAIADRGVVLERGAVVLEGSGADLLGRAEVAARYLGLGAATTGTTAPADLAPRLRALVRQEGNSP